MENKKSSNKGIVIAILCFMIFFIGMYGEYQITPVAGDLMASLGIGQAEYMKLLTFCMFPALFLSIISGSLCDRFGIKRTVGIFLIVSTVGIAGRYFFTTKYVPLLICSTALGLGCMMLTATNAKILGAHFSPEKLGSVIGIVSAANTIGMFLAQSTTALLPSVKVAFLIAGVISILITICWFLLIKEPKAAEGMPDAPTVSIGESIKVCFKNKFLWFGGLALCCVMTGQVILSGNLPQVLVSSRGFTEASAGSVSSMYMIGCIIGNLCGPIMFYRLKSSGAKRAFLTVAALIIGAGVAFCWLIPNTVIMCVALALTGACVSTIIPIFFAMPFSLPEIGPKYAGTAGGFQATVQILGATVVPTYIITPLCGVNFSVTFIVAGIIAACALIFINMTPVVKSVN